MRPLLRASLAVVLASPLTAQVTTLDEGSFTLFVQGERVGREEFTVRRVPEGGGFAVLASATVTIGDQRLTPVLRADTAGNPHVYDLEIRDAGRVAGRINFITRGTRFEHWASTPVGEASRQGSLTPGTLILDEHVAHHYYFVAQRRHTTQVIVLVPRHLTRDTLRITPRGQATVELSAGSVRAEHLVLADGSGTVTDLWVDAAGRVLRLAIPARGLVAVRDDPPQ